MKNNMMLDENFKKLDDCVTHLERIMPELITNQKDQNIINSIKGIIYKLNEIEMSYFETELLHQITKLNYNLNLIIGLQDIDKINNIIEIRIKKLLSLLSIRSNILGYRYLVDVILLYAFSTFPQKNIHFMSVYDDIGKANNTSGKNVYRCITYAADEAATYAPTEVLDIIFDGEFYAKNNVRITPANFIRKLTDVCKNSDHPIWKYNK